MGKEHLTRVLEIETACFSDPWPREAFARELAAKAGGGYPRVLVDDGEVRAFAISWFVADEANLGNLAVDPRCRHRGYGRILLEDLLAEAERRALVSIWLEVRAGNDAAQRLYLAYGFRVVGLRRGYYRKEREDALVMGLDLTGRRE
jgi:ribosomal-protein-alanine N-acetyltransferase